MVDIVQLKVYFGDSLVISARLMLSSRNSINQATAVRPLARIGPALGD